MKACNLEVTHHNTIQSVCLVTDNSASQLLDGIAPPRIHIHCDFVTFSPNQQPWTSPVTACPPLRHSNEGQEESDQDEKDAFEKWLVQRWAKKDALMERYYRDGDFVYGTSIGQMSDMPGRNTYIQVPFRPSKRTEFATFLRAPVTILLVLLSWALGRRVVSSLVK